MKLTTAVSKALVVLSPGTVASIAPAVAGPFGAELEKEKVYSFCGGDCVDRIVRLGTDGDARGNDHALAATGIGDGNLADTGQGSCWRGQQYSGVYLRTDVDFTRTDKDGKLIEADCAGYGIVGRALGQRVAQHVRGKSQ